MEYIRRDYYETLYGEIDEKTFNRLSWDACRLLDAHTTGIDNVKKLKVAFPTDNDDAEIVKRCACALVQFLNAVESAEKSAMEMAGFVATEQGMRGKVVSSITSGNESISYSTAKVETSVYAAAKSKQEKDSAIRNMIREYLSGVTDANGVNLLYMGRYPHV